MTERMNPQVVDVHALVGRYPGGRSRANDVIDAQLKRNTANG